MALDQSKCAYVDRAPFTPLSAERLKHLYRCVILWPVFSAYLAVVVLDAGIGDISNG